MPGPFPGMDPYLEDRGLWRGVHHQLIAALSAALNAVLPPDFVARIDMRLYIIESERSIYPDVTIARRSAPSDRGGRGNVATLSPPDVDTPVFVRGLSEEMHEGFINIVVAHEPERVVTAIELLSPANKAPGTGREEYVRKQRDALRSETHLLEIDLLRAGTHTVAAPQTRLALEHGAWDSLICLHLAGTGDEYETWPRTLRDRLPRIFVPLLEGRPAVRLDLQAVFDRAYDEGAFDRSVDYRADPNPPFSAEDAPWADTLLREKNLRN